MTDAKDITYLDSNVGLELDSVNKRLAELGKPRAAPAPAPTPTPTPTIGKLITLPFFGMHPINGPWSSQYKTGALGKPANVKWAHVETAPGTYNWTQYLDKSVDAAQAAKIDMIYNSCGSPGSTPAFYQDGLNNWPADFNKLTNFIKVVDARYKTRNPGVVIWYEIFNEFYSYNVPPPQLVKYANAVCNAVGASRCIGPDLNGRESWPEKADEYFTLGGRKDVHALTVHGYSAFAALSGANVPEAMEHDFSFPKQGILAGLMPILTKHGLLNKLIWDTEGSWGPNYSYIGGVNNQDIEAAYTARWLLVHMLKYDRTYWYGHSAEGQRWGTLQARKGEIAFKQVQDWTVGARLVDYTKTSSVRRTTFARDGGYKALAVWDFGVNGYDGLSTMVVPAGMTIARDLTGTSRAVAPGTTVQIGMKPILLESSKL